MRSRSATGALDHGNAVRSAALLAVATFARKCAITGMAGQGVIKALRSGR